MCYSTLIEADLKKLGMRFNSVVNWLSVGEAYSLRDKYKVAHIPAALDTYIIQNAETRAQKQMAAMAKAHYQREIGRLIEKKAKYEQDCLEFAEKIKKGSKAKDLSGKLARREQSVLKLGQQIASYNSIADKGSGRIFPGYYAPAIIAGKSGREVQLMRYHILPKSGQELPTFKYNLFNARRDRLLASKIWRPLFGHQHAILPFYRFYENVDDGFGGNQVIYFETGEHELMWSAAIYEKVKIKEGFMASLAAITDEPPPEVLAAGHDRCPIFLQESLFDQWLLPDKLSSQELLALLDAKTPVHFVHHPAA